MRCFANCCGCRLCTPSSAAHRFWPEDLEGDPLEMPAGVTWMLQGQALSLWENNICQRLPLLFGHVQSRTRPASPHDHRGVGWGDHLCQDGFEEREAAIEVHVVAHTLGLAAINGRVRPKARLKLLFRQQIHPDHLRSSDAFASLYEHLPVK